MAVSVYLHVECFLRTRMLVSGPVLPPLRGTILSMRSSAIVYEDSPSTIVAAIFTTTAFFAPGVCVVLASRASSVVLCSFCSASRSLPFLPQPEALDGSMIGDVGFDPLGLATSDNLDR